MWYWCKEATKLFKKGSAHIFKCHLVEVGVEVGLEVGETGDKEIKRLQKYQVRPDMILNYGCAHTHTHTHTKLAGFAFTETPWHESHLATSCHRKPQA